MGCSSSAPESQKDSGGAGQKEGSQKKTASGKDATPVTQNVVVVDNQGAKIHDSYDIDKKKLGEGSYGTVSICTSKATKQKRAVKALSKTQMKNIEKFKEEIRIMQLMDHPNIIKLYEAFEDKVKVYLVMELCSGGELFDRIIDLGHFTEVQAAIVMQQMFRAVYYMHQRRLCHRGSRKKEKRDAAEIPHSAGVSTEMAEGRAHGMKVGTLCGEAYNDSNNPGSNTRTQRSWLYEPDAALQNIHYGGKKPPVPSKDSELSIPIGEGAMAKVRADLKARQGRLYRVATQITKGNHHRPGISIFQDDVIENPVMYA